ncbi:MAG: GDSL-like Lipase/Acylhydrolase [Lentisphaerae bacterium ADurb.Bin242]|nr:MAG: GDSL-like Lipase/Acylhydrolase [Lentisphaerae bacterium ADurb.Bin242]
MHRFFVPVLIAFCALPLFGQNLLNNPGFENSSSWLKPAYWAGKFSIVKPGLTGKSCGELKAAREGKAFYGRCYQLARIDSPWGRRFSYSMKARGSGELYLGCLEYTKDSQDKIVSKLIYSAPLVLKKEEWQEIKMNIQSTEPTLIRFAPLIEVRGENAAAYLDEGSLVYSPAPGAAMSVSPAHLVAEDGKPLPEVAFRLTENGKPVPDAALKAFLGGKLQDSATDRDGRFVVRPGDKDSELLVSAVKYGVAADVFIDRLSPAAWNRTDGLARKIKLEKPVSILYLGDSLSDFERGRNYADKVNFWLNRYHPGKAAFRNAGVGGDYITRVRQRMIQGGAYRQEQYDRLLETPYDYIFIFLGHNDTRCLSTKNYEVPQVTPEEQKTAYREVIGHLRKHSKARIVLVSPTSSNFEVCKQSADKQKALDKVHALFGQPAMLEAFDAVLRQLAEEENLDYLDVYAPMKNEAEKAALFSPSDGVHLTEAGNRFLTDLFLEYLASPK